MEDVEVYTLMDGTKVILITLYNDTQIRKDEQINFMKIINQLSDVVKELKDQNTIKNISKQPNNRVLEQKMQWIEQRYHKTPLSNTNNAKTVAEREYNSSTIPLNDIQQALPSWDQIFGSQRSRESNNSSKTHSVHTSNSYYCRNLEDGHEFKKEKCVDLSKRVKNKPNNNFSKILRDKCKKMSLKLRKQEQRLEKTRIILKEFKAQEKSLITMVEELKQDKERQKVIIESLVIKADKLAKDDNLDQMQLETIKDLKDRILKIEQRIFENGQVVDQENVNLLQELKQANLQKNEYQTKNIQLNKEISECTMKLALYRKQIDDLKDTIRKEKALNESMKQAYEMDVRNVVGDAAQEQRRLIEDMKMSFDSSMAALQVENSELKGKISQLEEDSKKICHNSKIRVVKAKKQLYSQATIVSQKLLKADIKIKEFYYAIEKMLKGIYHRLYGEELEHIKRKCQEGGVQAASHILGVSAAQMSRVLATGALPSLHEWIDCCKRLVYREKFADDLAAFILSLFWPISPSDIAKENDSEDA